jgi:phage terminase large subunit
MLSLKQKQQTAVEAASNPKISTIVLIGAVGTGKTDVAAHIVSSIAYAFPKTYWPVFRQNISTAKRSVIPSYLNMLEMMNLVEGDDFIHNQQDHEITFRHNRSIIGFVEADYTKDRQGRKIKGINATGNHIDEADELEQTIFTTATSRRGRHNNSGQPSLSIVTMNPNDTYLKGLYYDPWKAGTLPDDTVVIEFTIEDSWQNAADIAAMERNPKPWVERYLRNNWGYHDDADSLFKYRSFAASLTADLDDQARRYVGYDVARVQGGDRSVAALWYGTTLVDIQVVKDKEEQMTTDEQALWLIKFITQNSVLAESTSVDGVGLGVGVIDFMKSRGLKVNEFISGARATSEIYDKLRSEVIYKFARGLETGEIKIYEGCPYRNELISEAMAHNHKTTDKRLAVESKDEVKKRTGSLSPDIFDAVVMGLATQAASKSAENHIIF